MTSIIGFIEQFGGKVGVLNLILLVLFCSIICSLIKRRIKKLLLSIILASFVVLQVIALYFNQTFVGYQFYVHFNTRDSTLMLALYKVQLIILFLLLLVFVMVFYHSRTIFRTLKRRFKASNKSLLNTISKKLYLFKYICLVLSIIIMCLPRGVFYKSFETLLMLKPNSENFTEAVNVLNIHDYVSPESIKSTPGKNIIIISLESIEKGFLSDTLAHLTPNLRALKNTWNYLDINKNYGSEWTSGSLYTTLTGFPAFFGVEGNSIFQKTHKSNITSISNTLKKANYDLSFFIGDANFSGTKEMLFSFGLTNIIDKYSLNNKGQDKDIFDAAKSKLLDYKSRDKPFALFISTTDTHFPNGIYDERMEQHLTPQKNQFEFMVSAVDYLVNDFIAFLKANNLLETTIVYIFPDHQKMGDPSIFKGSGHRGLYVLSNSNKLNSFDKPDTELYQIDLPKLILEGAEVSHNQVFLTDYITGNKDRFIRNNVHEITAINTSGLSRIGGKSTSIKLKSKHYNSYASDTLRFIAHAGGRIDGIRYTNSLEALNENYAKGFRLFELDILKTSDHKFVAAHDWEHWSKLTGYKGQLPVSKSEFLNHKILKKYTPLDLEQINHWFTNHPDAVLVTDKINVPKEFATVFIDKSRLMMELFSLEALKEAIDIGIKSAIPSQKIIDNLKGNKAQSLHEMGIKDVAISRTFIEENKAFLEQLKALNINAYAYHINFKKDVTEDYVVKYEMDHIYGIYADSWVFPN